MRIAFISYEYPPDTASGGIATYVYQAAAMLRDRGHEVEVFTASDHREEVSDENGVKVHRICLLDRNHFPDKIGSVFAARHAVAKFDVLEGPEYGAEAREAVRLVPDIPLVVRLHIPTFFIEKLNRNLTPYTFVRGSLRAIRRRQKPFWYYNSRRDIERLHTRDADTVVALCKSLGEMLLKQWRLEPAKLFYAPNPYIPSPELLNLPIETSTDTVTFLGRLEKRKGVLDLASAIPMVLRQNPSIKFRFVGRSWPSPDARLGMQQYIEKMLAAHLQSIEFVDHVELKAIPSLLAATDVCAFPSIWENFPNVCLEAMSAGRAVIGSSAGGMSEMLNGGQAGRLVDPHRPDQIAKAVVELFNDKNERMRLGQLARQRVLEEYNIYKVGALQEESYLSAIKRRRSAGTRR